MQTIKTNSWSVNLFCHVCNANSKQSFLMHEQSKYDQDAKPLAPNKVTNCCRGYSNVQVKPYSFQQRISSTFQTCFFHLKTFKIHDGKPRYNCEENSNFVSLAENESSHLVLYVLNTIFKVSTKIILHIKPQNLFLKADLEMCL